MKIKTLFCWLFLSCTVLAISQSNKSISSTNIIVQLKDDIEPNTFQQDFSKEITFQKTLSKRFQAFLFSVNDPTQFSLSNFQKHADVINANWDLHVEFRDTLPNDLLFPDQWDMQLIELPEVWAVSQGGHTPAGREIVVAVIDHDFQTDHEDLLENIWTNPAEIPNDGIDNDGNGFVDDLHGWSFRDDSPIFQIKEDDHGTNVCGIIGAKGNNQIGLSGVNWNVKMMLLEFELTSQIIPAFEYILTMRELYNATDGEQGAFIVVTNGSFGLTVPVACETQPIWAAMYDHLGQAGILSVAATPNKYLDVDIEGDMPTSCPNEHLITVTNTDREDEKVYNAAFGKTAIDLSAPGRETTTTDPFLVYKNTFGGTSASAPHVAGAIALLYSLPCPDLEELMEKEPTKAALVIKNAIFNGVDQLPSLQGITTTGGRLNVNNSMRYLHNYCLSQTTERESGDFENRYIDAEKEILKVYPNPTSDILKIEYAIEDFTEFSVTVTNVLGQKMFTPIISVTKPFIAQTIVIDVVDLSAGSYFIAIEDSGKNVTYPFIKI